MNRSPNLPWQAFQQQRDAAAAGLEPVTLFSLPDWEKLGFTCTDRGSFTEGEDTLDFSLYEHPDGGRVFLQESYVEKEGGLYVTSYKADTAALARIPPRYRQLPGSD